ncbi:glycosyltransferase family 2 protein [Jannaschia ovalis]|uniref:Glycosyltransferase family 2 protein n=1 Tax=Jannaschia ovalis TaxID=3038773 RepID=A0ABY8LIC6_9RHOB|nr:glycosyltransferase family 2 protein [Jannaschia sp. GRR-S6-38]WGH80148.1 glycosyltransferase family 2 protein [Jannaschia sp. GRR-S6-38]
MRITSVTPMKDEGPFILEWLAYHRLIGFNDFLVFTNDCTDGSDALLDRLDELGYLRHLPNPSMMLDHGRHHWAVLEYANYMGRLKRADWVFSFDVDEFLCINAGDGTLAALFAALPEAEAISVNQLNFGSAGMRNFDERLLIERFTRSAELAVPSEGRASRRGIKTLTSKRAGMARLSNHSPRFDADRAETVNWVNASGRPVPMRNRTSEIKVLEGPDVSYELAQLNHYALRSVDSFLMQSARGNANHPDKAASMVYWRRYDHNHVENTAITRWVEPVRAEIARMLQDAELAALHDACVAAHRRRIAELKSEDHYAMLARRTRVVHERTWGPAEADL